MRNTNKMLKKIRNTQYWQLCQIRNNYAKKGPDFKTDKERRKKKNTRSRS